MSRKGRPRAPIENERQATFRESWRRSSAKYYKENREKILLKVKKELPCWGCPGLVEWQGASTKFVYTDEMHYLCEYKQKFVNPNVKKKCDREPVRIEDVS